MPAPPTARGTPGLRHRTGCRARPAWRAAPPRYSLRLLQIRLECVDRDLHGRVGIRAPQLPAVEHHGIEPLRVLARLDRRAIWKDMAALIALDPADMATHVAGQPRLRGGGVVLGGHATPGLKFRGSWGRRAERAR